MGLKDLQIQKWQYFLGVSLLLGMVIGLSSTDGTSLSDLTFVLLWCVQTTVAVGVLLLVQIAVQRIGLGRHLPLMQLFITGCLGVIIVSPMLFSIDLIQGDNEWPASPLAALSGLGGEILGSGPPVLLAWVAMNLPFITQINAGTIPEAEQPETEQDVTSAPAFLSLASGLTGRLTYLQSELHYLKIVTEHGQALVLYNLKDALADMPEDAGFQIHRSYWVSADQIERFKATGRQGIVVLKNGTELPVSRSFKAAVQERLNQGQPTL